MEEVKQGYQSLSHSKWDCKYHIVFIPKKRRRALFGQVRRHLGKIFHALAQQKECQILEGHLLPDHVHMCIAIPPKHPVASVIGHWILKAIWLTLSSSVRSKICWKRMARAGHRVLWSAAPYRRRRKETPVLRATRGGFVPGIVQPRIHPGVYAVWGPDSARDRKVARFCGL